MQFWIITVVLFHLPVARGKSQLPEAAAIYPLNGLSKFADITGKNPAGSSTVEVTLAEGPYNDPDGAYYFAGTANSYIEIPRSASLNTQYSITILAWVYHEGQSGPIFQYRRNNWGYHFWFTAPNQLFVRPQKKGPLWVNAQIYNGNFAGSWHRVGATYDHATGMSSLWVDGKMAVQEHLGTYELDTDAEIRIGARLNDGRYFKGRISCVQIYNKALTEEQIKSVKDRCRDCLFPLGMEDSSIPNDSIKSWSSILGKFLPAEARLNGPFSWCTAENIDQKNGPFLEVTLGKPSKITALATQGFSDFFVSKYQISYKVGNSFHWYQEDGKNKRITGNSDGQTVRVALLANPFVTQTVRVIPVASNILSCVTLEIYGCELYRVFARRTNGLYYKGVIDSETADSRNIKFDDGNRVTHSKADTKAVVMDVDPPKSAVTMGTEVIAWWPNRVRYYPGYVDKVENDRYYIKYNDGDEGWARIDQLRVYNL